MIEQIVLTVVAAVLLFELLEHVILPLVSLGRRKTRRPASGPERMVGRAVVVRTWQGTGGLVAIDGELWRGTCEAPLNPGDEAVIRAVQGLTLELGPIEPGSPPGGTVGAVRGPGSPPDGLPDGSPEGLRPRP